MSAAPQNPIDTDAPLTNFSQCHAGILRHLNDFGQLPELLEPAQRLRQIAERFVEFFREAVFEHHQEEERELFPAVLASAEPGPERQRVQQMVDQLTREHRDVEAAWRRLQPHLQHIAAGRDSDLDVVALQALVAHYKGHARYEESQFLPLAQRILGRNSNHLAALGLSLHMRRAMPQVMGSYGYRV